MPRRPTQGAALPPERERRLVLAAKAGNASAREEFVEAFLPLIGSVARRYRNSGGIDRSELMQEGVVGLLRGLDRYDAQVGCPFWPYASWWVRQAMQRLVAELARPVVMSDRALRQLARVKDAHREHLQSRGQEPSSSELAERSGLSRRQVDNLAAVDRPPRCLDEPVQRGDEHVGTFGDLVEDPLAEAAYEQLERREDVEELHRAAGGLGDRERIVLSARFGLDGPPRTLRQIAGQLGLSAERVRQIEECALGKLRETAAAG
jgi:RNA polymerase sigma factor (sigma-70 family)